MRDGHAGPGVGLGDLFGSLATQLFHDSDTSIASESKSKSSKHLKLL